ncbi:MAG: hypothetical protein FWC26_02255 [Fibromonadales bacterium]|nr:hypothetical protein [Fibromonadales bacterium]
MFSSPRLCIKCNIRNADREFDNGESLCYCTECAKLLGMGRFSEKNKEKAKITNSITVTKNDIELTQDGFKCSQEYLEVLKKIAYCYISESGEKIFYEKETGEEKGRGVGLAKLALRVFEEKLNKLAAAQRRALKTNRKKENFGVWKEREFVAKWGEPKKTQFRKCKITGFYFYGFGLYDGIIMCETLMKEFGDAGKFVVEYTDELDLSGNKPMSEERKRARDYTEGYIAHLEQEISSSTS